MQYMSPSRNSSQIYKFTKKLVIQYVSIKKHLKIFKFSKEIVMQYMSPSRNSSQIFKFASTFSLKFARETCERNILI